MRTPDFASAKSAVLTCLVGAVGLVGLYFWSPTEIPHFPRCPFLTFTGYQCPGCGTLRCIHALLHFHFMEALRYNILTVLFLLLIPLFIVFPKFRLNVVVGRIILGATLSWWLIRNLAN